jgi:hypothetical protein
MAATKHFKTILVSNFWTTATVAQKNEGPRGDFTCKQQPLCKKNPASSQESYFSNFDYIYGSEQQGQLSMKQLWK